MTHEGYTERLKSRESSILEVLLGYTINYNKDRIFTPLDPNLYKRIQVYISISVYNLRVN